jgi:hypothetical protein
VSALNYEALAAWAEAAAARVADPRAALMLEQQATAIREAATLRAENARLREDAALMANAMLGRTPDRNVQDGEQCTATQAAIDEAVARCAALAAKEPGHDSDV